MMAFEITSTALRWGEVIPEDYTADGRNVGDEEKGTRKAGENHGSNH